MTVTCHTHAWDAPMPAIGGDELRVLICGSRDWTDPRPIRTVLQALEPPVVVIHGAARGADTLAHQCALALGYQVRAYPADWDRYGRRAGYLRNRRMLDEGRPHIAFAFRSSPSSHGTNMMVRLARDAGITVYIITPDPIDNTSRGAVTP